VWKSGVWYPELANSSEFKSPKKRIPIALTEKNIEALIHWGLALPASIAASGPMQWALYTKTGNDDGTDHGFTGSTDTRRVSNPTV
jgi:hypothetical protein